MLHLCGMFKPLPSFSTTRKKGQVNRAAGEQEESLNNHDSGAEDNVDEQMNSAVTVYDVTGADFENSLSFRSIRKELESSMKIEIS